MNEETKNKRLSFLKVKVQAHRDTIESIRGIQQDVIAGRLSLQEAHLAIEDEHRNLINQLKAVRDYYDLYSALGETLNG